MAVGRTMNLDTILVEEIGGFGRFQLRMVLIATVAIMFSAGHISYVFTAAKIKTRCLIPECESNSTEFSPPWITDAIPHDAGALNNCQRYANVSQGFNNSCPASMFDNNTLVNCDEYVYENKLSAVYDFDLACDEWRRSLVGTIRTMGTLVSMPVTGYVSDRWGRRVALALNSFNTFWLGLVRYWANNYFWFTFLQFAEAALGAGTFSCIHILVCELLGPQYRVMASSYLFTAFAMGQIMTALLAWAVPAWRANTLALYLPQIVSILYFWILPESARWYMSKGKYKELEKLLKNAAKVNRKQLSEESLAMLRQSSNKEVRQENEEDEAKVAAKPEWLIVRVFQHKRVFLRCLCSPVWWISMSLIFHGLGINAVNMTFGNPYINFILVAAADIPGFWLSMLLLPRLGRRPVLNAGFWICSACQFAYIFISSDMYWLSLAVYLIGKSSISAVATGLYVYTTELYPTECRHTLFAYSSMVGRIGTITAPLTPAIGAATFYNFPFLIFGVMSFISGFMVLLTPETLNTKLPDTLEEADDLGLKRPTSS